MVVGGFAKLIQDWRDLQITLSLVVLVVGGLGFLLPESPRWLIAKGKSKQAKKLMKKAAKMNGKTIPKELIEAIDYDTDEDGELFNMSNSHIVWY